MCKGTLRPVIGAIIYCLVAIYPSQAQKAPTATPRPTKIQALTNIEVTCNETSFLVFPYPIKRFDWGNADVLTKTVKDIENVLKVKAARPTMKKTNLTVFTADGGIYPFSLQYAESPDNLIVNLSAINEQPAGEVIFAGDRANEAKVSELADSILKLEKGRPHVRSKVKGGMHFRLTGIYLKSGITFFRFNIGNATQVPYVIDFTRFYIRDCHRSKKTVNTEKEVKPLLVRLHQERIVAPHGHNILVVAFPTFTIADKKNFSAELYEQNGDRQLSCNIKGKCLLKAKGLH